MQRLTEVGGAQVLHFVEAAGAQALTWVRHGPRDLSLSVSRHKQPPHAQISLCFRVRSFMQFKTA